MESLVVGLCEEVRELNLGTSTQVERLEAPPSPLQFLRMFVCANKPCIISNATLHWPALSAWTDNDYLKEALVDRIVSVHFTPDGRADALVPYPSPSSSSLCFASADVHRVPFPRALELISTSRSSNEGGAVAYAQEQNDCFRSEYSPLLLLGDVEEDIPWATSALGSMPEAVNLWIGNDKSQTSFHKDHYENLYAVITGEKHFLLLPPTDVHRLYVKDYPAATYSYSQVLDHSSRCGLSLGVAFFSGGTHVFTLELEKPLRYVPWCSVNPYPSPAMEEREISRFPRYFNGPKPFSCTVKAGEILYLPSMWFHHVSQSPDGQGRTIAVNYWYDMQFDIKYAYFNFLQSIDITSANASSRKCFDCEESSSCGDDGDIQSPFETDLFDG